MTAYAALAALLHAGSGLVLGQDKTYLLEARLAPLLARENLPGLEALAARLSGCPVDAGLARDVVEAMTTNETLFFRDGKPFTHFAQTALPRLRATPGRKLRLWSAAAASGQEAYSLAMVMRESAPWQQVEIVGTDLSHEQVARAQAGLFTQFEVQRGLPVQRLLRHFKREEGGWRIDPALRAACAFHRCNLLGDLRPLGLFDVVFLRNVLIYLDAADKRRVLAAIAAQTAPGGLLYLGATDSVAVADAGFTPLDEPGVYGRVERGRAAA